MSYSFEEISERHRTGVINVFNYYVANGFAVYSSEPVDYDAFDRLLKIAQAYPSLVVKDDSGEVVGYAFLSSYHPADSFRRTTKIAYFIMPEHTGKGLGATILEKLVAQAREQEIEIILANISSRNEGSLRFHCRHGFRECGRFRRIGQKFGKDFDVVWMQLDLKSNTNH
ncbi:MAG: GNAT family N-acetyltransferase [Anaerolineae bacterium]|jgi:phosphinothricin acetyltransferase